MKLLSNLNLSLPRLSASSAANFIMATMALLLLVFCASDDLINFQFSENALPDTEMVSVSHIHHGQQVQHTVLKQHHKPVSNIQQAAGSPLFALTADQPSFSHNSPEWQTRYLTQDNIRDPPH